MDRREWLAALHTAHYATLLKLAQNRLRKLTGSISEAEDVVQDVFRLAAEKNIQHLKLPIAWMIKATYNFCMQRWARARRDVGITLKFIRKKMDNSADRSVYAVERAESEIDELLWLVLLEQSLLPEEWEIMRKYCLEGMSLEDLAAELGMPPNRLKVRIYRIRKKIEKILRNM